MRGVNKVIIVGNLGSDPEVKQFANGGSVTRIACLLYTSPSPRDS